MSENVKKSFSQDEEGGILAFTLVLFLLMVVGSGMALDFMRQEANRAELQDALDRGVLAAASLTQTVVVDSNGDDDLNEEYAVLIDQYMDSRTFTEWEAYPIVDATTEENYRSISAEASYEIDTYFLRLIGISTLPVLAKAQAQHARNDVEISLVLDVSGSMFSNNVTVAGVSRTRLEQLQIDAKAFVTYMLDEDVDEAGNPLNKTTFSIVPYSAQAAPPYALAKHFSNLQPFHGASEVHTYSYCFDFDVVDYTTAAIAPDGTFRQFPHFRDSSSRKGCPRTANEFTVVNNNETELHDAIDALARENWTAIYNGVKWGVGLLDPAIRPAIDGMVSEGEVSSIFSGLPRDYAADTGENLVKALVVMSDGRNTRYPTMRPENYNGPDGDLGADHWDNTSTSSNWGCTRSSTNKPKYSKFDDDCNIQTGTASSELWGVGTDLLSSETITQYPGTTTTVTEADAVLFEICNRAKDEGIVIYAIGFELTTGSRGARALAECASGDNKFFPVDALNLSEAFDAIAADILNLKLTN